MTGKEQTQLTTLKGRVRLIEASLASVSTERDRYKQMLALLGEMLSPFIVGFKKWDDE